MIYPPTARPGDQPLLSAAVVSLFMVGLALFVTIAMAQSEPCEDPYPVRPGDNLERIAIRCNTTVAALLAVNPHITSPEQVVPGQQLNIPPVSSIPAAEGIPITAPGEHYTVQPGDTLSRIAARFGVSTDELLRLNPQITNPNLIYPGQQIVIPGSIVEAAVPPEPPPPPPPDQPQEPPGPEPVPLTGPSSEVLYEDDFANLTLWPTITEANFRTRYHAGGYRFFVAPANLSAASVLNFNYADIRLEVDVARIAGAASGYYGVVCRWQDAHNFYAFVISGDGNYRILRIVNGEMTILNQGSDPVHFAQPEGVLARIGGSCAGDTLTLYLAGQPLLQAQDQAFTSGLVGLVAAAPESPGLEVHFSQFALLRP